ncbi:hypothetical protein QM588_04540 [Rhodococcus sp. IEGM 1354]|uniref:N,N-dimethylformamidase beta subunit family domain-containing protein n=1 Tax=Rhodococcus sp. IEGM 1354 TaxID=3047088 RepID=UPI0024B69E0C|nr:N,N-dimethylformamidase beta subunit family domain-containing protein [Rhodococcus sp. IEGM 1354]MDI9929667.1 hypothetical protein [Rhodococcus sp. IEGM 1354]
MEIVGYSDRLSVQGGESITFQVSSKGGVPYEAEIVRLIHGDTRPGTPGFKSQPVESSIEGRYAGTEQHIRPGSYIEIPKQLDLSDVDDVTVDLWFWPTTPKRGRQTLLSWCPKSDDGLWIGLENGAAVVHAAGATVSIGSIEERTWQRLTLSCAHAGILKLRIESVQTTNSSTVRTASTAISFASDATGEISIGADRNGEFPSCFYNGKIEAPRLYSAAFADNHTFEHETPAGSPNDLLAAWDFEIGIDGWSIADTSGHGYDGRAVNMPMRAATGRKFDGSETAWRHANSHYGAIHFHDDDLFDAGWDAAFSWVVPTDLKSGVYAAHVSTGSSDDYIPFTVRPTAGQSSAKVVLLLPTFTYLAYANEQLLNQSDAMSHIDYPVQKQDKYIVDNRLLSLYDKHSDGSGVCYSSRLRPIVNMRPQCVMAWLDEGRGSPHNLNADLYIVDWLHEHDIDFDVITDEDLHLEGRAVVDPYNVVLTGTHPEYWSVSMIRSMQNYLKSGGRMMYLGGNGMYWVTQLDPSTGASVEIRRRGPSTRAWETEPGEAHLSSTGELGGLWRHRGLAPQSWVGVGFTAETPGAGRPYERRPESFGEAGGFVFRNIDDEVIGDMPNLIQTYGAAGYEFDRADSMLGTPGNTTILATATGFSDHAQACSEEILTSDSMQSGSVSPLVKTDMALVEYPNGGAVFSTGSITWSGCLSQNNYRNNVSAVTRNVLSAFARDGEDYRS